jgi:hypothetical protein
VLALDRTRVSVQIDDAVEIANQTKNIKQTKEKSLLLFFFFFYKKHESKKTNCKIKLLIITRRKVKSI